MTDKLGALRYATVADERHNLLRSIIAALAEHPERAQAVIQMPQRRKACPPEVWIEDIAAWVRLDGTWCSFDLARGAFRPTDSQTMRIRLAAEKWKSAVAANDASERTAHDPR